MYIVKMLFFSFNVEDNYTFPCLNTIRLSYNISTSFSALSIRMRMSIYNSKHGSFLCLKVMKTRTQKGEHSFKCTELSLQRI